jgi:hypothetical protein
LGFLLAFVIGVVCRFARIPSPAPQAIEGPTRSFYEHGLRVNRDMACSTIEDDVLLVSTAKSFESWREVMQVIQFKQFGDPSQLHLQAGDQWDEAFDSGRNVDAPSARDHDVDTSTYIDGLPTHMEPRFVRLRMHGIANRELRPQPVLKQPLLCLAMTVVPYQANGDRIAKHSVAIEIRANYRQKSFSCPSICVETTIHPVE